jgi:hypothetical protein
MLTFTPALLLPLTPNQSLEDSLAAVPTVKMHTNSSKTPVAH